MGVSTLSLYPCFSMLDAAWGSGFHSGLLYDLPVHCCLKLICFLLFAAMLPSTVLIPTALFMLHTSCYDAGCCYERFWSIFNLAGFQYKDYSSLHSCRFSFFCSKVSLSVTSDCGMGSVTSFQNFQIVRPLAGLLGIVYHCIFDVFHEFPFDPHLCLYHDSFLMPDLWPCPQ